MKRVWSSLRRIWCQAMHPSPMWPVNGQYRCPTCMRVYRVPWESDPHATSPARSEKLERPKRTLKPAAVPVTE